MAEPLQSAQPESPGEMRARLGHLWQIPLLLAAMVCFAASVALLFTSVVAREEKLTPEIVQALAEDALDAGRLAEADQHCETFLTYWPSDEAAARIYEIQGDANYRTARVTFEGELQYLKKAAEAYRNANDRRPDGLPSPTVLLKLGKVHRRFEKPEETRAAIDCYNTALQSAPADPLPIYQAKVEALRSLGGDENQQAALEVIRTARQSIQDLRPGELVDLALEEADILSTLGRHDEAERLLTGLYQEETDVGHSMRFLIQMALTQWNAGNHVQALDTLLSVIEDPTTDPNAEVLVPQAMLLAGRVSRDNYNSRDALHWFRRAATEYPESPEALAARLGMAETYLGLGEFDRAKAIYAEIGPQLRGLRPGQNPWVDMAAARAVLKAHVEVALMQDRLDDARELVMIEHSILYRPDRDVLARRAQILAAAAERLAQKAEALDRDDPQWLDLRRAAERDWREAGELFMRIAESFDGLTDRQYNEDLWLAIDAFRRAGAHEQAAEALQTFLKYVSNDDSRRPQAMLDLARQWQVIGRNDQAIETLQTLTEEHPSTLPGFEGYYLLGRALIRKGPEFYPQAEDAFLRLLENSDVEPQSMWYQRCLLELGRLLHRQGKYDQAIIRLNEYIARLGDRGQVLSARYLLASSLRQQGIGALAAARDATRLADRQALRDLHRSKLQQAIEEFEAIIERYESLPAEAMDELHEQQYQASLFDLAACLHELGRIDEAVRVYNVIVYRFQTSPSVMSAYVKLADIYLAGGQNDEYAAVLERARWTLEKIPDQAFAARLGAPGKQHWLNWIQTMQLPRKAEGGRNVADG